MRTIAAILLSAFGLHAQIAYVTSSAAGSSQTSGTATLAVTMGTSLTAGNTIVCAVYDAAGINKSNTVTDGDSNTYAKDKSANLATDGDTFGVFHADAIAIGTQNPPVATAHGSNIVGIVCAAFSGLATSSFDKTASQNTSGTSLTSTATSTLSQANELVIGAVGMEFGFGGGSTMTVGSGFTILNIRAHSGSCSSGVACPATAFLGLEYQIVSSTTGIAATWTFSPSLEYAAIVTTYKQAASAAACTLTLIGVGRGC